MFEDDCSELYDISIAHALAPVVAAAADASRIADAIDPIAPVVVAQALGSTQVDISAMINSSATELRLVYKWHANVGGPLHDCWCSLVHRKARLPDSTEVVDLVDFVSWQDATVKRGRVFHTDDRGRLKWSVPVRDIFKVMSFNDADIILPNAGVVAAKPRTDRPTVPQDSLDIQSMWLRAWNLSNASASEAPEPDSDLSCRTCCICNLSGDACRLCAVCCVASHPACLRALILGSAPQLQLWRRSGEAGLRVGFEFPVLFEGLVCDLCTACSCNDADLHEHLQHMATMQGHS